MASITASSPAGARKRTKRSGKTLTIVVLAILAAGLGWWQWNAAHPPDNTADKLITDKVKRGDLLESISATGSVTSQTGTQVKIGSQITGQIKRLYADVGSFVHAGDPIAVLDLPDLEAQVRQAQANLEAARTKLIQLRTGVNLEKTTTTETINQNRAALRSAEAKLASAIAAANQQTAQTPTDIDKAKAALSVSQAALSTAISNQKQVQASVNLEVATAEEQVTQSKATYDNAAITLKRNQDLLDKKFVAKSVVDNYQQAATVALSQLAAARQNVQLTKEKVAADLQSASDQVAQARQNVDAAQAALKAAQAETYLDAAKLADVDDARAAVNQARANLKTALAGTVNDTLKQQDIEEAEEAERAAKAQVDYNQAQMAKSIIRSPITGTVLQLASQQGETLAAGLAAPTLIIVADLNRLQVDAYVDETDIGHVKMGQSASIVVDAFPHHTFTGKVIKIASGSTIQQGVVTYDVTISLDRSTLQHYLLKPDMTANVIIQTGKLQNVLLVPSVAVKVGTKGSTVSVVTHQDGKTVIVPHKVKTGGSDDTNTEIREGLNEGDTIVLAGMDANHSGFGPASPFGPSNNRTGGAKSGGGGR